MVIEESTIRSLYYDALIKQTDLLITKINPGNTKGVNSTPLFFFIFSETPEIFRKK